MSVAAFWKLARQLVLEPAQFVQSWVFERIFNWWSWPQILGGWQITLSVKAFADFNILLIVEIRWVCKRHQAQEDGLLLIAWYIWSWHCLHWGLSSSSCNRHLIWREIIFTLPTLTSKPSYHTVTKNVWLASLHNNGIIV